MSSSGGSMDNIPKSICVIDLSTILLPGNNKNNGDHNKLHPLGIELRTAIQNAVESANANPNITSIILYSGRDGNFSAGADLVELQNFNKGSNTSPTGMYPSLLDVNECIETSSKPVVAAISGICFGGGCELAMSCQYRVANDSAKFGLPEVHVGVIPGAGGTQKLPRLVGLQTALQTILTGAPMSSNKAHSIGLIDAVTTSTSSSSHELLLPLAVKWSRWAESLVTSSNALRRTYQLKVKEDPATAHVMCHAASLGLPKQGVDGWHAALVACKASVTSKTFQEGMDVEAQMFKQTLVSHQGKARRHGFFAIRTAQKPVVGSPQNQANIRNHRLLLKDISAVQTGVIGAGTMGGGIALVLLQTGYCVTVVDVSAKALEAGMKQIRATIQRNVKTKKVSAIKGKSMLSRLSSSVSVNDLGHCDLVIEAVIEKMVVKRSIFTTLDKITKSSCILVSNTSTLSIDEMAKSLQPSRRASFAGLHFFSPANIMKLVEIVTGEHTSPSTVMLLQSVSKRIGKYGVVVGNCDGFVGNRLLRPYSAETVMLLVEGGKSAASPPSYEHIDAVLVKFGMALGPFQMGDLAGNDIGYNIRKERQHVQPNIGQRPNRYTELADDMVSQLGRLGQKAGKGWYDYSASIGRGRKPLPSVEMQSFVQKYIETTTAAAVVDDAEIIARVLYPLVNEGFKCLEENIARCPSDIDVVYLYGYGWPMSLGGPMYWADQYVTLPVLLQKLRTYAKQYPCTDHYVPSKLLVECVQRGCTVEEYYSQRHQTTTSRQSKL